MSFKLRTEGFTPILGLTILLFRMFQYGHICLQQNCKFKILVETVRSYCNVTFYNLMFF